METLEKLGFTEPEIVIALSDPAIWYDVNRRLYYSRTTKKFREKNKK